MLAGAREHGYVVEAASVDYAGDRKPAGAEFVVASEGRTDSLRGSHAGFEARYALDGRDVLALLEELVGQRAHTVTIRDHGPRAEALARSAVERAVPVIDRYDYPRLVAPLGRAERGAGEAPRRGHSGTIFRRFHANCGDTGSASELLVDRRHRAMPSVIRAHSSIATRYRWPASLGASAAVVFATYTDLGSLPAPFRAALVTFWAWYASPVLGPATSFTVLVASALVLAVLNPHNLPRTAT